MIHNTLIYKGCVILQYGYNIIIYKNGKIIHEKESNELQSSLFAQELSKIVTMIDEGEI